MIGAAAGCSSATGRPFGLAGTSSPSRRRRSKLRPPRFRSRPKPDPLPAALISGIAVLLFAILGSLFIAGRVARKKAKMAKEKAIGGGNAAVIALIWTGSVIGFIILAVVSKSLLPSLLSLGLAPAAATFGQVLAMKSLRRKIAGYRAPCGNCGQPMRLLDEQADDAFLSAEEIAEETAGGMNYEVWRLRRLRSIGEISPETRQGGPLSPMQTADARHDDDHPRGRDEPRPGKGEDRGRLQESELRLS